MKGNNLNKPICNNEKLSDSNDLYSNDIDKYSNISNHPGLDQRVLNTTENEETNDKLMTIQDDVGGFTMNASCPN